MKLKLRSIGTSTGVILPKQLLDRPETERRTMSCLRRKTSGGLPADALRTRKSEKQVKLGLQIMKEHRGRRSGALAK